MIAQKGGTGGWLLGGTARLKRSAADAGEGPLERAAGRHSPGPLLRPRLPLPRNLRQQRLQPLPLRARPAGHLRVLQRVQGGVRHHQRERERSGLREEPLGVEGPSAAGVGALSGVLRACGVWGRGSRTHSCGLGVGAMKWERERVGLRASGWRPRAP